MSKTLQILTRAAMVLLVSFLIFGCSKDDDNPQTSSDLIIGTWQVTADVISPAIDLGSGPISDLYAISDACDRDDLYIINKNGVGEFSEGATKCDPADPQTEPFTWALSNNDQTLTISGGGTSASFTVAQLNSTTMKLTIKETILGTEYTETITYTRR